MSFSFVDWVDSLCWNLLNDMPGNEKWLLRQTIYTAVSRRQVIPTLPFKSGQTIADFGTGYGVMAIEMAQALGVQVIGVDIDDTVLNYARTLSQAIYGTQAPVEFIHANVYHLPFADQSLDGITARFLFQHLNEPQRVAHEAFRVLKPSAIMVIEDIDDGLILEYPSLPPSWQHVMNAFRTLQARHGGDREVGRKLPFYLHQAGLVVDAVQIHPLAQFSAQNPHDLNYQFERERIEQVLPELYKEHLLSPDQWQSALKDLMAVEGKWMLQSASTLRIIAHRPG
ncbi:methyltransferase domain-containing protein [Sulfobacillus thermosulfidooxidans]|uniref:methyltransferase domain-containing protein n=1 Tax=Sulfobacillus thermosulfidooxidans TaxID=28034 RepID=UPI00041454F1|nr:methyltransferase domain-containing protein [Sulfobacillus thermosulfidooxidans]